MVSRPGRSLVGRGSRVEYRDDQDNPFRFVAQRTVVGCGTGQLEPRFQEICEERAGKP